MNVKIYQVRKDIDERRDLSFMDYRLACSFIKKLNGIAEDAEFEFKNYLDDYFEVVYEYEETIDMIPEDLLDTVIYPKFNRGTSPETPTDFKGHSLSTSDIVALEGKLYYCDAYGWKYIGG